MQTMQMMQKLFSRTFDEKFCQYKKSTYLCSTKTKRHLALWCNGSTSDSGSACEGSNPSKATRV